LYPLSFVAAVRPDGKAAASDRSGEPDVMAERDLGAAFPCVRTAMQGTAGTCAGQFGLTEGVTRRWFVAVVPARASADGKAWRDLPAGIPPGKIVASPGGTLVNVSPSRGTILRSEDGGRTWAEVHAFTLETQYVHGGQGLGDVAFGLIAPAPAGK
jgi:hypothetical protein